MELDKLAKHNSFIMTQRIAHWYVDLYLHQFHPISSSIKSKMQWGQLLFDDKWKVDLKA
jgi:hypothetical protein